MTRLGRFWRQWLLYGPAAPPPKRERLSVPLSEIDVQRERGWPDFHPEDFCHRCGGRNVSSWFAPSPLWNAVMRGGSIMGREDYNGIVCPQCFVELAEAHGVVERSTWQLRTEYVRVPLETTDPDGRVWDDAHSLWVDPS